MNNQNVPKHASMIPDRHPVLPRGLSDQELENFLRLNCVDAPVFDEQKQYFTDAELVEFAKESSAKGREINRLEDVLKAITSAIRKGTNKPLTFEIPVTAGTKKLVEHRRENDDYAERGYVMEERELFGIPSFEDAQIVFFDVTGRMYPERTRGMSAKERHTYRGMFDKIQQTPEGDVDTNTGEVIERDGTNG